MENGEGVKMWLLSDGSTFPLESSPDICSLYRHHTIHSQYYPNNKSITTDSWQRWRKDGIPDPAGQFDFHDLFCPHQTDGVSAKSGIVKT